MSNAQSEKTTIFIVDSVGAHRGMHYYNFALASALNSLGVMAVLISTLETVGHPLSPKNVPVRGGFRGIYGDHPRWLRGLSYALSLLRIGRWAWREKPRAVHFHFYQIPILDYILLYWLQTLGIKTITTVHDVLPFDLSTDFASQRGKIYHRLYAKSSGLILNSQYARDCLAKLDSTLLSKSVVIPHGNYASMDQQESITSQDAKIKLGLKPSAPVILVFGTIKPNKRLDWVIEAITMVSHNHPEAILIVAGKPRDQDVSSFVDLADQLGVAQNVVWRLDYVTDEEVIWYFSAADVAVFPYQWIYQSGALLMAMNFSAPVVATSVGSNVDIIQDGKTGILVPAGAPDAMGKAISILLGDKERAHAMGVAAYEYVTNELSWQKIAESTLAFYRQIWSD